MNHPALPNADETESSVMVAVRVRPMSEQELARGQVGVVSVHKRTTSVIEPELLQLQESGAAGIERADLKRDFTFDFSFWSHGGNTGANPDAGNQAHATQRDVFEALGRQFVVHNALRGYNCGILAYGQTGSGKTYTMMGEDANAADAPSAAGGTGAEAASSRRARSGGYELELEHEGDPDAAADAEVIALTGPMVCGENAGADEATRDLGDEGPGLVPRICAELFGHLNGTSDTDLGFVVAASSVHASFYEIYNEHVFDLFGAREKGQPGSRVALRVREDQKRGTFVEGLSSVRVESNDEVTLLLQRGMRARSVASTDMNRASSRSHAVFTLTLRMMQAPTHIDAEAQSPSSSNSGEDDTAGANLSPQREHENGDPVGLTEKTSKICLVDLAGSERIEASGVTGARLRETAAINKSLSTLSEVIKALAQRDQERSYERRHSLHSAANAAAAKGSRAPPPPPRTSHLMVIPYRNSTLTRLLKECIGGNSKTVMLAAVSPTSASYRETLATLRYVQRAKMIKVRATVNLEEVSPLVTQLRTELHRTRAALSREVREHAADAEEALDQIDELRGRCETAEAEADAAQEDLKQAQRKAAHAAKLTAEAKALARNACKEAEAANVAVKLARVKEAEAVARATRAEEQAQASSASLSAARTEAEHAVEEAQALRNDLQRQKDIVQEQARAHDQELASQRAAHGQDVEERRAAHQAELDAASEALQTLTARRNAEQQRALNEQQERSAEELRDALQKRETALLQQLSEAREGHAVAMSQLKQQLDAAKAAHAVEQVRVEDIQKKLTRAHDDGAAALQATIEGAQQAQSAALEEAAQRHATEMMATRKSAEDAQNLSAQRLAELNEQNLHLRETQDKLRQENMTLNKKADALQQQCTEAEDEQGQSRARADALEDELKQARQQARADLLTANQEAQQKQTDAVAAIRQEAEAQLQAELSSQSAVHLDAVQALRRELSLSSQLVDEHRASAESAEAACQALQRSDTELRNEVASLKSDLESQLRQHDEMSKIQQTAEGQIVELGAALEKERDAARASLIDAEKRAQDELNKTLNEAKHEHDRVLNEKLTVQASAHDISIQVMRDELTAFQAKAKSAGDTAEQLLGRNAELEKDFQQLKKELQNTIAARDQASQMSEQRQIRVDQLEKELKHVRDSSSEALDAAMQEAARTVSQAVTDARTEMATKAREELASVIERHDRSMQAAQSDLDDAKQVASACAAELDAAKHSLEELRAVHSKLVKDAQATNYELKKVREDSHVAEGEHAKTQARVMELDVKLKEQRLNAQLALDEAKTTATQTQQDAVKQACSELSADYERRLSLQAQTHAEAVSKLNNDVHAARQLADENDQSKRAATEECARYQDAEVALESKIASLSARLDEQKREHSILLASHEEAVASAVSHKSELAKERESFATALKAAHDSAQRAQEQALEQASEEYDVKLKTAIAQQEASHSDTVELIRSELAASSQTVEERGTALASAQSECDALRSEKTMLEEAASLATAQLQVSQEECTQARNALAVTTTRVAELEAQIMEDKENASKSLSQALDAAKQTKAEAAENASKLQKAMELQAKEHSTALDAARHDAATATELAEERADQLRTAKAVGEQLLHTNTKLEEQVAISHAQLEHRTNEHVLVLRRCEESAMRCAELETLVVKARESGRAALEDAVQASQLAQAEAVRAVKLEQQRIAEQAAHEQDAQQTRALEQARTESEAARRAAEKAEDSLKQSSVRYSELSAAQTVLESKLHEANDQLEELQQAHTSTQQSLGDTQTLVGQLREDLKQANQSNEMAQQAAQAAQKEKVKAISKAKREHDATLSAITEKHANEHKAVVSSLQAELAALSQTAEERSLALSSAQSDCDALRSERAALRESVEACASVSAQLAQLQDKHRRTVTEATRSKARIAELSGRIGELKAVVADATESKQAAMHAADEAAVQARQALSDVRQKHADEQAAVLAAQEEKHQQEIEAIRNELTSSTKITEEQSTELRAAANEHQALNSRITALMSDLTTTQEQLEISRGECCHLQKAQATLESRIAETESEAAKDRERAKADLKAATEAADQAQRQALDEAQRAHDSKLKAAFQVHLAKHESEAFALRAQIDEASQLAQERRCEVEAMTVQRDELQKSLATLEARASSTSAELTKLQSEHAQTMEAHGADRSTIVQLESQLSEQQQRTQDAEANMQQSTQRLEELKATLSRVQDEALQNGARLKSCLDKAENESAITLERKLKAQAEEHAKVVAAVRSELKASNAMVGEQRAGMVAITERCETLTQTAADLQGEVESLRGKLTEAQEQNASLSKAHDTAASRIVELEAKQEKDRAAVQDMRDKSQKSQDDAVQRACSEQTAKFKSELAAQAAERDMAVQELRMQLHSTAQAAQKQHDELQAANAMRVSLLASQAALEQQIQSNSVELDELRRAHAGTKNAHDAAEARAAELESELANERERARAALTEAQDCAQGELQQTLSQLTSQHELDIDSRSTAQAKEYVQAAATMREELTSLQTSSSQQSEAIKALEAEREALQRSNDKLENEVRAVSEAHAAVVRDHADDTARIRNLESELERVAQTKEQAMAAHLKAQADMHNAEMQSCRAEAKDQADENIALQEVATNAVREAEKLKGQVAELQVQHDNAVTAMRRDHESALQAQGDDHIAQQNVAASAVREVEKLKAQVIELQVQHDNAVTAMRRDHESALQAQADEHIAQQKAAASATENIAQASAHRVAEQADELERMNAALASLRASEAALQQDLELATSRFDEMRTDHADLVREEAQARERIEELQVALSQAHMDSNDHKASNDEADSTDNEQRIRVAVADALAQQKRELESMHTARIEAQCNEAEQRIAALRKVQDRRRGSTEAEAQAEADEEVQRRATAQAQELIREWLEGSPTAMARHAARLRPNLVTADGSSGSGSDHEDDFDRANTADVARADGIRGEKEEEAEEVVKKWKDRAHRCRAAAERYRRKLRELQHVQQDGFKGGRRRTRRGEPPLSPSRGGLGNTFYFECDRLPTVSLVDAIIDEERVQKDNLDTVPVVPDKDRGESAGSGGRREDQRCEQMPPKLLELARLHAQLRLEEQVAERAEQARQDALEQAEDDITALEKRVISGCLRVRGVRDDGAVDAPLGKEVWERLVIDVGEDAALASLDDVSKLLRARITRASRKTEQSRKSASAQRMADRAVERELEMRLLRTQRRWQLEASRELGSAARSPRKGQPQQSTVAQGAVAAVASASKWLQSIKGAAAQSIGSVLPHEDDFAKQ